eukprot:723905_1
MAEETPASNPYVDTNLAQAQQQYCPQKNKQFETMHTVIKKTRHKKKDNDRNYRHVWFDADSSEEENSYSSAAEEPEGPEIQDRLLRGNEENTEKLVTKFVRDQQNELQLRIPECIGSICFQFSYEPTNITFNDYDDRISHYVSISNEGKMVNVSARTIFIFSKDGYNSGHHIWHIKCHRVHNCQALGICEHKNAKYRYGDNIFDVALNDQLGDRYIYAGDSGHSWRGSNELRPYVSSVINEEEYYSKRLLLRNSVWSRGDIITVDVDLGSGCKDDNKKRYIRFLKNGKELCEPIRVVKKCMYYPVFQVYQRGTFEIIDDITKEAMYQPETEKDDSSDDSSD